MNSIYLGRVFGIDVRVHFLFVLMMLFFAVSFGPAQVLYVGVLFGLVLLHELGHSLVAQRFGIRVLDITFWPLGGMARMSEIPENSRIEGWIAIAGPAVNFALALIGLPVLLLAGGVEAARASGALQVMSFANLAGVFVAMNLMLGLFNLVPAFPMDGGRILRAFLGRKGDWVRATEQAVSVGRFIAIAMCIIGVLSRPMICVLPLIGLFVWWTGARELWAVRLRHGQIGPGIRFTTGGAGGPGGPGIDPLELFRRAAAGQGPGGAPRRDPGSSETDLPPHGSGGSGGSGGFSDEDIERLERYRGRLRDE